MTWFITEQTQINCAETGAWLSRTDNGWRYGGIPEGGMWVTDESALAMLAALGYRWTGTAIEKIGTPPADPASEPRLVRVDLSQPVEGGYYLVKVKGGSWYSVYHARGTRLSCEIAIAYRLPGNTP